MVNKQRLYWTLQIGGWFCYAALQIVFSIASTKGDIQVKRLIFFVVEAVLFLFTTHFFRIGVIRSRWVNLHMGKVIPRVLFSALGMGLVVYLLRMPASLLLGFSATGFDPEQSIGLTAVYAMLCFFWSVLYFTYQYFERYSKSLKYETSMIEIKLNNLRSQLNPHFIFNALNSIRALVDEDPQKCKDAINKLSNILRNSLSPGNSGLTKFQDELKVVQDYLGLESIRFEERLKIEFDIDPRSAAFLVPPLMIQTLIENGIKHGISQLKEGGTIQLTTKVLAEGLCVQIRNSGRLSHGSNPADMGLGIKNTIQRLELIYGAKSCFRIANENNTFVLTEIIIPQTKIDDSTSN